MNITLVTILLFGSMLLGMALGLPIAWTLGGVGVILALFLWGPESLTMALFGVTTVMNYGSLICIPLFVFMGLILQKSGVIDAFYISMEKWFGFVPGALAVATIGACTAIAAMVGEITPATLTMGTIALPAMLKRGYQKEISIGSIQAGAALGFLIPPSVVAVLYATLARQSIGKFFAGGMVPGLILSAMYIAYIVVRCSLQPSLAPRVPREERASWGEKFDSLKSLIIPTVLIVGVLGAILFGICTPVEASAIGAIGSIVAAAVVRKLTWPVFKDAMDYTLKLTSVAIWIFIAALSFGKVYQALGAPALIQEFINIAPGGAWGILIMIQLSYFLFGMALDDTAILFICLPIYLPIAAQLGFDPIWFGVLYIINMEMAYLTPPFGYCLFLMRAVAPKDITMGDIYRSIWPFVGIQAVCLIMCMIFPAIILWLPNLLFGK